MSYILKVKINDNWVDIPAIKGDSGVIPYTSADAGPGGNRGGGAGGAASQVGSSATFYGSGGGGGGGGNKNGGSGYQGVCYIRIPASEFV